MAARLTFLLAVFVLVVLTVPSPAQDPCVADSDYVVSDVVLPSTTTLTKSQLGDVRVRLIGRCIQKSQLAEMADRVHDAYQNFGYFQAHVDEPELTVIDPSRRPAPVRLAFRVDEGPQFKLRAIEFNGVRAFQPDEIWSMSPLGIDDVFDTSKVRELLEGLRRAYVAKGYPHLTVTPETEIVGTKGVKLTLIVDENPSSK